MPPTTYLYLGFIAFVLVVVTLDLGLFHRKDRPPQSTRSALGWTIGFISLALVFTVPLYFMYEHHWLDIGRNVLQADRSRHDVGGMEAVGLFLTAWIVEYSLSTDNIFVMAVIFTYFGVPAAYQRRVLTWGILGALIMRGVMIAGASVLLSALTWTIYVFAGLLIVTAIKLLLSGDESVHPDKNLLVRIARRIFPVTGAFHGERFFVRVDGKRAMTPLFLVLLVIESTDVVFAVDSIPAVFAVTLDPFLVFTSNVFAILGLRSLYFVLLSLLPRFKYLKPALVTVLLFVGVKMLLHDLVKIPTLLSLGIVAGLLGTGVAASLLATRGEKGKAPVPPPAEPPLAT